MGNIAHPRTADLSRRSEIGSFIVMDVMRRAFEREAAGERIIHMEVGQPGTPAPKRARDAAHAALGEQLLGYTDALGIPPLRARIARHYAEWYGLDIDQDRVVVTTGSSAGFILAFLTFFDPGMRLALPSPGYPCYRHIVRVLGLEAEILVTDEATRWMPDSESISAAHRRQPLDGLLIASPANPTGTMLDRDSLGEIVATCRDLGIRFISDEIYHGLTYERPAGTALAHGDDVIVINSFSKYFSMTGWRIGWMVVPADAVRTVERLQQNLMISVPTISQYAALGALDAGEELEGYKDVYRGNRELLLEALPGIGFDRLTPADGAFYLYCDVSELTTDSAAMSRHILEEAGVAVTPGLDFDTERGNRYLRFSYARSRDDMNEAIERLAHWRSRA